MLHQPQTCYLDVTDPSWFRFHQSRQAIEVNFWRPSKTPFRALKPGQNILFKLKSPYNHVAGGGTFVRYEQTRLSEAWRLYGVMNGFSSLKEMQAKLAKPSDPDPIIGCKILEGCVFYDQAEWQPCPSSFSRNIVSGRTYGTDELDGQALNAELEERRLLLFRQRALGLPTDDPFRDQLLEWSEWRVERETGKAYLARPRLGQGSFRSLVLDAYQNTCAITGEHTTPVLEAAHILPYSEHGPHSVNNALLLRSDFHTLFDRGYITVTDEYRLEVSTSIREHFNNGVRYEQRRGHQIALPAESSLYPDVELLKWHNEHVFMG